MGWIIAYLISLMIVGNTRCMVIMTRRGINDKVIIENGEDLFDANCFLLLWPIIVPILFVKRIIEIEMEAEKEKANDIVDRRLLNSSKMDHDRSSMVEVPEHDLKLVLKAYRRKQISLKPAAVEMIRDELLHRNMERNLLK